MILEGIRDQLDFDRHRALETGTVMGCDFNPYNNSRLVNLLFKLLHENFLPQAGVCPIQVFCYDLDFGRQGLGKDPIGDLWKELTHGLTKAAS
tara:strand:+ start:418 stop:696 length:279 start_codon:yes stop_codon:yes gene_type:complete